MRFEKPEKIDARRLFRLWHNDKLSNGDICAALGVGASMLAGLKARYGLPHRGIDRAGATRRISDPDQETIAQRAAEIRAGWPAGEAERRFVGKSAVRVEIKEFYYNGRHCAFDCR